MIETTWAPSGLIPPPDKSLILVTEGVYDKFTAMRALLSLRLSSELCDPSAFLCIPWTPSGKSIQSRPVSGPII